MPNIVKYTMNIIYTRFVYNNIFCVFGHKRKME